MAASVRCIFEPTTCTCQYVVSCPATKECAIIDPVLGYDPITGITSTSNVDAVVDHCIGEGLDVQWLLETHPHADHLSAQAYLRQRFPKAITAIGEHVVAVQKTFKPKYNMDDLKTDGSQFSKLFKDGEVFKIGNIAVEVLHTPGHTPSCLTYYLKDDAVFTGDTLFMPDMGSARLFSCDFPGGSAELLWNSIQRILRLPDQTRCFVGHDYAPGGREYAWETTIAEQKQSNKHVKSGTSKEHFIKMRTERDATLNLPRLLHPSMQFNIRGVKAYCLSETKYKKRRPPLAENGKHFVRVPLTLHEHLKD